MEDQQRARLVTRQGLVGNVHQGGKRQITLIEREVWSSIMDELGTQVDPSARRANLMVSGIALAESKGKILRVAGCCIRIMGETRPCDVMDQAFPGLKEALGPDWGGGAYGEALDDGEIEVGDPVRWQDDTALSED